MRRLHPQAPLVGVPTGQRTPWRPSGHEVRARGGARLVDQDRDVPLIAPGCAGRPLLHGAPEQVRSRLAPARGAADDRRGDDPAGAGGGEAVESAALPRTPATRYGRLRGRSNSPSTRAVRACGWRPPPPAAIRRNAASPPGSACRCTIASGPAWRAGGPGLRNAASPRSPRSTAVLPGPASKRWQAERRPSPPGKGGTPPRGRPLRAPRRRPGPDRPRGGPTGHPPPSRAGRPAP